MRPHLRLLSDDLVKQIIREGLVRSGDPGVRVHNARALALLPDTGAEVDW